MKKQLTRDSHGQARSQATATGPRRSQQWARLTLAWLLAALVAVLAACTTGQPVDDSPGTLVVLVNGLPAGAQGTVNVAGPGFSEELTSSDTLAGLTAGNYLVTAATVSFEGVDYAASVSGSPAAVTPNGVATATVTYAATSDAPGDLLVTVTGLPDGVEGAVTVTGPAGTEQLTATATLADVQPGIYTVTAADVDDGGDIYAATVTGSPATVPAGGSTSVTVTYSFLDPAAFGSLAVAISGLPAATGAAVNVTGPGGFDQDLDASDTLANLTPGFYVVSGADVSAGGISYTAVVETSPVLVIPDATAAVSVTYLPVAPDDGDAQSNPGWSAKFRATSGNPVTVSEILFNSAAPLDVKGLQLVNVIGDPEDPGDWLEFELVHGQGQVTQVSFELECLTAYTGGSPIRVELRDDDGAKLGTSVTCNTSANIAIPNEGTADYLVSVIPTVTAPYYMEYVLSIDAFCFQACAYQPFEP